MQIGATDVTTKRSAKTDGMEGYGPSAQNSGKSPFPGVLPGSGGVADQENPRRQRRQEYDPKVQPRESGMKY
jgi:hypothetical protein